MTDTTKLCVRSRGQSSTSRLVFGRKSRNRWERQVTQVEGERSFLLSVVADGKRIAL